MVQKKKQKILFPNCFVHVIFKCIITDIHLPVLVDMDIHFPISHMFWKQPTCFRPKFMNFGSLVLLPQPHLFQILFIVFKFHQVDDIDIAHVQKSGFFQGRYRQTRPACPVGFWLRCPCRYCRQSPSWPCAQ